ncbi:MAG: hypothetical protein IJI75_14310 [Solobacterium sp.]|nr:hypothetical protein [Solobacterium sp.]
MDQKTYFTITGTNYFLGMEVFRPGQKLKLMKDLRNGYDDEAIGIYSDTDVKYGYVANSVSTVARGTHSAGYLYRMFDFEAECTVLFILPTGIIASLDIPKSSD